MIGCGVVSFLFAFLSGARNAALQTLLPIIRFFTNGRPSRYSAFGDARAHPLATR
jgi:hypothetical protein